MRNTIFHRARVAVEGTSEYRSAKDGRRMEKRAEGMLRGLRKVQSQRRCIGCGVSKRVVADVEAFCTSREAREERYRTSPSRSPPRPYSCHSRHPLDFRPFPLSSVGSPVTRDHRDKARHHRRRQGRTMPHARVTKNVGAGGGGGGGRAEDFIPG